VHYSSCHGIYRRWGKGLKQRVDNAPFFCHAIDQFITSCPSINLWCWTCMMIFSCAAHWGRRLCGKSIQRRYASGSSHYEASIQPPDKHDVLYWYCCIWYCYAFASTLDETAYRPNIHSIFASLLLRTLVPNQQGRVVAVHGDKVVGAVPSPVCIAHCLKIHSVFSFLGEFVQVFINQRGQEVRKPSIKQPTLPRDAKWWPA